MNWDDLQKEWKSETPTKGEDMELVMKDVQKRASKFRRTIVWRDVREVAASVLLMGVFGYVAYQSPGAARWGALAMVAAAAFVAVFMLVDRYLQKPRRKVELDPVAAIRQAIAELDHQIWLLRNVFWWYLLPFAFGTLGWAVGIAEEAPVHPVLVVAGFAVVEIAIMIFVYWLNQVAVRKDLLPQRQALEERLARWEGEPS